MQIKDRFFVILTVILIGAIGFIPSPGEGQPAGWHMQTLPAPEGGATYRLRDVKALGVHEAWIAGSLSNGEAVVLKTLDGANWSLMFRKGDDTDPWQRFWEFGRLSVLDSNNAWAAGAFGLTALTTDGGATWSHEGTPCNSGPGGPPQHNYGLKAVSPTNVWTTGWLSDQYMGQIWHRPYVGDCKDWGWWPWRLEAQYGYATVLAIDAADARNAWAVGYPGILHTTDSGDTWVTEERPPGGLLADVAVVSPTVAWAVGGGGLIVKTVDGGAHWVSQGSGVQQDLRKISAVSADVAWVAGNNGTILKTVDGGVTWRSQVLPAAHTDVTLMGIAAVDANTAWAVSDQQIVLHVTDGGVNQPLSAPAISGFSPAGVPIAGGSGSVFLGGRDFRPGARVYFNGIPAASVAFRSAGELMVKPPAHAAGIVDVTVVNPDGQTATLANAFAFADVQPLIVGLNPSYGYVNTTVELEIHGAGLTPDEASYEPLPTVNINGTAVPGTYASYSSVYVTFNRSLLTDTGLVDITVTTAAGTSNTLQFTVNYGSVEVQRPYTPPYNKSITIPCLSGAIQTTFYGLNRDGWIRVGKVFETPDWLGGSWAPAGYIFLPNYYYDVTTHSAMYYQAATICFPYAEADVAAAGLDESKLRLLRYMDYSMPWEDVTFTLDTTANLICGTTAGLGTYFAIAEGPVPVPPPAMTAIEPAIGPPAGGTTVMIDGNLFSPNATVTFGGAAATNVTVLSGKRITATIPAHALGVVDVVVTNPDSQTSTLAGAFEYVGPPSVTSVTPDRGRYYTEVTIKGSGFRGGNGGSVKMDGVSMPSFSLIDDTTIVGYAPQHAVGPVDVVVTNPDGQSGILANGFTYVPPPVLTTVEPDAGPVDGGTTLTMTGTGFETGATVMFSGIAGTDIVVVDSTRLTAVTPAHTAGAVWVRVTNPDGQYGTRNPGFTYIVPGKGDLNADGVVNIKDAVAALQVLSMWRPSPKIATSADVDNDGIIGMAEAIFILQRAAEIR